MQFLFHVRYCLGPQAKTEKDGKSKAELRAERRAKQEAERAAKASSQAEKPEGKQTAAPKSAQPKRVPDEMQADRVSVEKRTVKRFASQKVILVTAD